MSKKAKPMTARITAVRDSSAQLTHAGKASKPRIAIIGAGASGICMAKCLIPDSADVTVFEIGTEIGGLWCYNNDNGLTAIYKTLHINTARNLTRFHDYDFKPDVQTFPSHEDMHEYLISYADHFGVTPCIRFKSKVTEVRPLFKPGAEVPRWEIVTESGARDQFDVVIVANGHQSIPLTQKNCDAVPRGIPAFARLS